MSLCLFLQSGSNTTHTPHSYIPRPTILRLFVSLSFIHPHPDSRIASTQTPPTATILPDPRQTNALSTTHHHHQGGPRVNTTFHSTPPTLSFTQPINVGSHNEDCCACFIYCRSGFRSGELCVSSLWREVVQRWGGGSKVKNREAWRFAQMVSRPCFVWNRWMEDGFLRCIHLLVIPWLEHCQLGMYPLLDGLCPGQKRAGLPETLSTLALVDVVSMLNNRTPPSSPPTSPPRVHRSSRP